MTRRSDPGSANEPPRPQAPKIFVAKDGSVAAEKIENLYHYQAPPADPWPVRVGAHAILAEPSAFQTRGNIREQVETARMRSTGVVLTQVLAGGGGVGKSQLAASYAREAISRGTDLVMWVDAAAPAAVIAAYSQAAIQVQAPGVTGKPTDVEANARKLLDWLAVTKRSWLVVLDDVTDPGQIANWWPTSHTDTGWVIATTRRRDAVLTGSGRVMVDVDVYNADESAAYLSQRLNRAGKKHLLDDQADSLAETLGHLPLALSHAAAYMIDQKIRCATYLARYNAGQERLDQLMPGDPDGHGRQPDGHSRRITVTLLLALEAADNCDPVGLARPAIALAAVLDPSGHPEAFWTDDAVASYLTSHRTPPPRPAPRATTATIGSPIPLVNAAPAPTDKATHVTADQARAAVMLLHRFSLANVDEHAGPRAVRVHALTARAARETAPAGQVPRTALAAADALLALWPDGSHIQPDLVTALRANADALYSHGTEALWHPAGHPLLKRVGFSLSDAGLHPAAVTYWQRLTSDAQRILGPDHPDTLNAQAELGYSCYWVGRIAEAITCSQKAAARMERVLGPEHPDTLAVQTHLALFYEKAGRSREAKAVGEKVAGAERIPRPAGFVSNVLIPALTGTGQVTDAIVFCQREAAEMERRLGPTHPDTLDMQSLLASLYAMAGRIAEAIDFGERVAATMEQSLGPDHSSTLNAQGIVAASYAEAGRIAEAIALGEKVVAGIERNLGPDHPDAFQMQAVLAECYEKAGRIADAIVLGERAAAGLKQTVGPDHPHTLHTQAALAAYYGMAGRPVDAMKLGARTVLGQWKLRLWRNPR